MRLDRGLLLLAGDFDPAARGGVVRPAVRVAQVHGEVLGALVRLNLPCNKAITTSNMPKTKTSPCVIHS